MAQPEGPALDELSPTEARAMYKALACASSRARRSSGSTTASCPAPDGDIPVRVYTPPRPSAPSRGVLLWFHGGGWVIGDLDTADATCRALANRAGRRRRLGRLPPGPRAPGARRPRGLRWPRSLWTVENAELLGVDADRVAVGGDSAGGNLAALVCQRVRDEFGPDIDFQLLVYPVTDLTLGHPSMDENAEGYFLTKAAMEWFTGHYLGRPGPARTPPSHRCSHERLSGSAPGAGDHRRVRPAPRRGRGLRRRARRGGRPVEHVRYDGQIHGFFAMPSMLDAAKEALDLAGAALRTALT